MNHHPAPDSSSCTGENQSECVYWDHCATTPPSPQVVEAMSASLRQHFANPSSAHCWGARARDQVEEARLALASLLNSAPRELFWTSGATEANNLALRGAAASAAQPIHIISQVTEHSAVLEPLRELRRLGHEVTFLEVNAHGQVEVESLRAALRPETRLISIMHTNNELGAVQPIAEIGALLRSLKPECLFHVDGAQAVGKVALNLEELPIDLLSLSAHKFYGPKGAGALYIRRSAVERGALAIEPLIRGGEQERGVRPGTLATHQIIGLGVAAREAQERISSGGPERLRALKLKLFEGLRRFDPQVIRRGHEEDAPHVLSITVSLRTLMLIEARWPYVAFSQGSACHSHSGAPSHVLTAIGLSAEEASRTLRFGLGQTTSEHQIERMLSILEK